MTYKNKLVFLVSLVSVLALIYTASLVFSPERINRRSASYTWLDSKTAGGINRIVIQGAENIDLSIKNNQWFVLHNGIELPVRRPRVEDFISIFTTRALWPVRSSSASSHAQLGLESEIASRVTIYGENSVLLDVLLGLEDSSGREIYIRKYGHDEVRSGDNVISSYIAGSVISWFNLMLFPSSAIVGFRETEDNIIDPDNIQRLTIHDDGETIIFTRRNREWTVSGIDDENTDQLAADNFIRVVLSTEGDNFEDAALFEEQVFNDSYISVEFSNGIIRTVYFTEPDETNRRFARVMGNEYIYSIPAWAAMRIFMSAESFVLQ